MGDTASTLYVILTGIVKVKTRDSFTEPLRVTATLVAGQSFGEVSVARDSVRYQLHIQN